jgi:ATP-dependent DNA helicase RecG
MPTQEYFEGLLSELCKLPAETQWVEFKENNENPEEIGEYVSALSNAAALSGKDYGYLVWGVRDGTHEVVGTKFKPGMAKKGGENLENWLVHSVNPRLLIQFHEFAFKEHPVVILEIPRALGQPVQFRGEEFIRLGSYRQKLKAHPQLEKELWRTFETASFEEQNALERVDSEKVVELLDYPTYFDLLKQPLPTDRDKILARMMEEKMIQPNQAGGWNITNLGAVLFAKNLDSFGRQGRKALRVIVYEGTSKIKTIREQGSRKGYASGFAGFIEFIATNTPRNEIIGKALRKDVPMYPDVAVRELVANAVIHQDLTIAGSGPMVEIFSDRIEITNPGTPIVNVNRFLDTPPRSRNEAMASFMRRVGICEERGSGVDKVVFETEFYQLPAPLFEVIEGSTRAVLFAHKALKDMDEADRSRACYLHA